MYVLEWYGMEWRVKRSECRIEYGAHMNILFFSSFRSWLSTCSVIFFFYFILRLFLCQTDGHIPLTLLQSICISAR